MAGLAPIAWAQRKDSVYFSVKLPDVTGSQIDLTETSLKFVGTSNGKEYKADLEFFAGLDPKAEGSKYEVRPRDVLFHIMKKDADAEGLWWPRLVKDKTKEKNQISVDWSRYKDEDEADGAFGDLGFGANASGFGGPGGEEDDYGGMGGMGGMMGGMGGMGGGMGGMGGMMGGGGGFGGLGGGAGGMDIQKLLAQMQAGGGGGMPGGYDDGGEDDGEDGEGQGGDSDDDLPELAADETATAGGAKPEAS